MSRLRGTQEERLFSHSASQPNAKHAMNTITQLSLAVVMSRPVLSAAQALLVQARYLRLEAQRRVELRRARRELQRLDAQTLRDLGLYECEASSAAAEHVGLTEPSRRRLAPMPRHLRRTALR